MKKSNALQEFIKNNNLEFSEGTRNSDAVILCGYGLFLDTDYIDIWESIPSEKRTPELTAELDRVFKYAEANNYGEWWKKEENTKKFKI